MQVMHSNSKQKALISDLALFPIFSMCSEPLVKHSRGKVKNFMLRHFNEDYTLGASKIGED